MLDSTRPIGETLNTELGRPKNISAGVLKSCLEATQPCWYVLRATYARELKFQAELQEKGIRTFVPMMWKSLPAESGLKGRKKLVPAISGLVFAFAAREALDAYIHSFGEARPINYYWDRTKEAPLTVPAKAMEDFIAVASTLDEDLIYLTEITQKLREGQTVEVIDGPFKGVKGKIVRIKKNRRVLVELPGFLAVTTNYLHPQSLRLEVDEKER